MIKRLLLIPMVFILLMSGSAAYASGSINCIQGAYSAQGLISAPGFFIQGHGSNNQITVQYECGNSCTKFNYFAETYNGTNYTAIQSSGGKCLYVTASLAVIEATKSCAQLAGNIRTIWLIASKNGNGTQPLILISLYKADFMVTYPPHNGYAVWVRHSTTGYYYSWDMPSASCPYSSKDYIHERIHS